jgi:molybdenum cofactor sulfurtransferase
LIDNIRHRVLRFFNADPQKFDVIFCANATAGMKLVAEAFSALEGGFEYKYHGEAHTSLIGLREVSRQARCLMSDTDVAEWLTTPRKDSKELGIVGLFGWPGQSNFNGRRFPSTWARELRNTHPEYYSLFDAASLVSSAPLDLSDSASAPDFTVLSFYKVFGFPDLGALIVRRDSCEILKRRRYFGGGTVESLIASTTDFVARKDGSPHSYLEDGTLPFLSIVALDAAMDTYERLYGGPGSVSKHIFSLGKLAYELLSELRHTNGQPLCVIYGIEDYNSPLKQGATIAFNLKRADGSWIGYVEVEKLASVKTIHIRVGSHCNPGGMENYVGLKPWEIRQNHATGQKCSDDNDIIGGKPTGAIRISLGAMSTLDDILTFIKFLEEFYVDQNMIAPSPEKVVGETAGAVVENLTICGNSLWIHDIQKRMTDF